MLGLKRGRVQLYSHKKEWEQIAAETIKNLGDILGNTAKDIQHIGSTSITHIKAKPIIDIAIAVRNFEDVVLLIPQLEENGFIHRPDNDNEHQMFFACGDFENDIRTHHIHVVIENSMEWINYINFRDYLNAFPEKAKEYENVKIELRQQFPDDRVAYTEGKAQFIKAVLRKALVWSYLGKTVTVNIDRPLGSVHPKHANMIYPINYGYIPNVISADAEELDVYVMGVEEPISQFCGNIVGIIHREDDMEDKLVAAPTNEKYTKAQIEEATNFQEQYFHTHIELAQ